MNQPLSAVEPASDYDDMPADGLQVWLGDAWLTLQMARSRAALGPPGLHVSSWLLHRFGLTNAALYLTVSVS